MTEILSILKVIWKYRRVATWIIFVALILYALFLTSRNAQLRATSDKNERNVTVLTEKLHQSLLRDSLHRTTTGVLLFSSTQIKKTADKSLLNDLKIKSKNIQSISEQEVITRDSIIFKLKDSTFEYRDTWAYFRASTRDSLFIYSVRDSITAIVHRLYKHRFLWFRWGTKGYQLDIINFNPHSRIQYAKYIERD